MIMSKSLKEIFNPIHNHLIQIDEIITSTLETGIQLIDESALYLFQKGGKKIRAGLVVLTNGLVNGIRDDICNIAAAVEIIHAATLIHDDIIDHSYLRRGDVTVPQKWGNKISVLAGDYLFTVALSIVLNDDNSDLYPVLVKGTSELVQGELYQLQYSNLGAISEEHYFKIIELKTARFMATCTELGAIKAGADSEKRESLYSFGLYLGYAFQLVDDILDITGSDSTGKDVANDLADGKITLPVLHYYQNADESAQQAIDDMLQDFSEEKWNTIKNRLIDSGSIQYCVSIVKKNIDNARHILDSFPDSEYKEILFELSGFLLDRNF